MSHLGILGRMFWDEREEDRGNCSGVTPYKLENKGEVLCRSNISMECVV